MATPAGATHSIPITSNPAKIPANMPDGGVSVIDGVLEIVEGGDNWEGGAQPFIDGLAADYSDLQITTEADVPVAFGIRQFSRVPGSRELRAGIGLPSLNSAVGTVYKLWRGCTGGPFENRAGVCPTASGFQGYWPLEAASGSLIDWTSNRDGVRSGCSQVAGQVAKAQAFDNTNDSVDIGSTLGLGVANITIMCWVYLADVTANGAFVSIGRPPSGPTGTGYGIGVGTNSWSNAGNNLLGVYSRLAWFDDNITIGTGWHHVVLTIDNSNNPDAYLDGAHVWSFTSCPIAPLLGSNIGDGAIVNFGRHIDEVIVADALRSANWITTYFNMTDDNDAFWTVGAEEAVGGGPIIGSGIIVPLPNYMRRR